MSVRSTLLVDESSDGECEEGDFACYVGAIYGECMGGVH